MLSESCVVADVLGEETEVRGVATGALRREARRAVPARVHLAQHFAPAAPGRALRCRWTTASEGQIHASEVGGQQPTPRRSARRAKAVSNLRAKGSFPPAHFSCRLATAGPRLEDKAKARRWSIQAPSGTLQPPDYAGGRSPLVGPR